MQMKKIVLITVVVGTTIFKTIACSICGCAGIGNYLGILPQYQKNYVGIRYNYRSFDFSHPGIVGNAVGSVGSQSFQSAEIMGRFVPGKRWQLIASLPFQKTVSVENNIASTKQGLGDLSMMAYYSLMNTKSASTKALRQLLQLGAGIKFPTGNNKQPGDLANYKPGIENGTGSFDEIFSAVYTLRRNKMGIITDANLQLTGTNKFGYRFGNKLSGGTKLFYTVKNCKSNWMLNAGVYGEFRYADHFNKELQYYSGGYLFMPTAGLDFFTKNCSFGANIKIPAAQNLADGYLKSNVQIAISVLYLFNN
jgi:hypothetical protein